MSVRGYFVVALVCLLTEVYATKGLTVKHRVPDFECLKKEGYSFIVPRSFISIGMIDPNVIHNLEGASKANMKADIYVKPCFNCPNPPEKQIEQIIKTLPATYRKMWIIVYLSDRWNKDRSKNCYTLRLMIQEAINQGKKVGIATNINNWYAVMGGACEFVEYIPELWLLLPDGKEETPNFERFGGMKDPVMKEMRVLDKICETEGNTIIAYGIQPKSDL